MRKQRVQQRHREVDDLLRHPNRYTGRPYTPPIEAPLVPAPEQSQPARADVLPWMLIWAVLSALLVVALVAILALKIAGDH